MIDDLFADAGATLLLGVVVGFVFSTLVSVLTSLALLYAQGRIRRTDRVRDHYMAAIADTRDRLLDLFQLVEHLSAEDVDGLRRLGAATRGLRYGRYRLDFLADAQVIDLMTAHLPVFILKWPTPPVETTRALSRLPNLTRMAMFDQELEVLKKGRPTLQSEAQRLAIDEMEQSMTASLARLSGWSKLRIGLRVFVRQWWPH